MVYGHVVKGGLGILGEGGRVGAKVKGIHGPRGVGQRWLILRGLWAYGQGWIGYLVRGSGAYGQG